MSHSFDMASENIIVFIVIIAQVTAKVKNYFWCRHQILTFQFVLESQ